MAAELFRRRWARSQSITPPSVLVVDDDEDSRMFVSHQLRRLGAQPVAVDSASAAMALLRRRKFDALITDLQLQHGQSTDVIWWAVLNGLPAAVLTASPDDARSWLPEERIRVIAKPAQDSELRALLSATGRGEVGVPGAARWGLGA